MVFLEQNIKLKSYAFILKIVENTCLKNIEIETKKMAKTSENKLQFCFFSDITLGTLTKRCPCYDYSIMTICVQQLYLIKVI